MRNLLLVTALVAAMLFVAGCPREERVEVRPGARLGLTSPGDITIERGTTRDVEINISRDDVQGPVTVSFSNLPRGVEVTNADQRIQDTSATYYLRANQDAALVDNHAATVTASVADASISQNFNITVTD